MQNSLLSSLMGEIPGSDMKNKQSEALAAETAKETQRVHDELVHAMSFPVDGEYHIRSVTKDRYLDVAYGKTENDAQIIGQTLNSTQTPNQRWKVTRTSSQGLPVIRFIKPVSDPARHLSTQENSTDAVSNVVTHERETKWIALPTPDGSFKLRQVDNIKVLSVHNSSDWNVVLADEEEGDSPQKYHQLWSFVENPYAK